MTEPNTPTPTTFDRTIGSLKNRPDTITTKATTIRHETPLDRFIQTFIVQTFRTAEAKTGSNGKETTRAQDTISIEYYAAEGLVRIALPPAVADCIARQRDALTTRTRRTAARAVAQDRKARGLKPAFLKGKKPPAKPDAGN